MSADAVRTGSAGPSYRAHILRTVEVDPLRLAPLRMSKFVAKVQGADLAEGAIWLVSDDETKGLHRVDLVTGRVDDLGSIGYRDGEVEGIDAHREGPRLLRVLSIDAAQVPVRAMDLEIQMDPGPAAGRE